MSTDASLDAARLTGLAPQFCDDIEAAIAYYRDKLGFALALHQELVTRGARITKPIEERPWACVDFYAEDADGYVLCFSEQTTHT